MPENPIQCAEHRAWIGFADDLAQEISQFVKQGKIITGDQTRLNFLFNILNEKVKGPYFFWDILSMVDITLISHILWIYALDQRVLPSPIICQYPNVASWLTSLKKRPSLIETMGENFSEHFVALLQRYDLLSGR